MKSNAATRFLAMLCLILLPAAVFSFTTVASSPKATFVDDALTITTSSDDIQAAYAFAALYDDDGRPIVVLPASITDGDYTAKTQIGLEVIPLVKVFLFDENLRPLSDAGIIRNVRNRNADIDIETTPLFP